MAGDRLAIDAFGLFGEKLDKSGTIADLALGLGQRLALFGGQDHRQIIGILDHQIEPAAQNRGTLLAGLLGPLLLRFFGGGNGLGNLRTAQIGDIGNHVAAGGVCHLECCAAVAVHPFAIYIGLLGQQ